jgi:hypothetical protein
VSIYAVRADIKTLLTPAGYTVHDHVPAQINGECIVIEPADNYVLPGDTFDPADVETRHWVWLFSELRDVEKAANDVDNMLAQVVPLLATSDHALVATTQPGPQTNGEWLAHGVRLTVETITTL